jgi:hypothetical protein
MSASCGWFQTRRKGGNILVVDSVQTLDGVFQSTVDRPPFPRFGLIQLAAEDSLTVVVVDPCVDGDLAARRALIPMDTG